MTEPFLLLPPLLRLLWFGHLENLKALKDEQEIWPTPPLCVWKPIIKPLMMITPAVFTSLVQNGMSLQQFKCLIQSPKCKHLPFLLLLLTTFGSYPKVCRNLLYNCKHPPPDFFKGGNITVSLLSFEKVHNVFTIAAFDLIVGNGIRCDAGPWSLAWYCLLTASHIRPFASPHWYLKKGRLVLQSRLRIEPMLEL